MAPLTASMSFPVGILFVNCFIITVTSITVALRFWSRFVKKHTLQANDYTIIAAWLCFMGLEISMNIGIVNGGLGQQADQLTEEEAVILAKTFIAITLFGIPTVTLAKISACDLFNKLFPNRSFHIACNSVIALLAGYVIAFTITSFAACIPFAKQYDPTVPGHCINESTYSTVAAAIGVVLDFIVVILPMPMVWQLQMPVRQKLFFTVIFSLALIICAISIGRVTVNANATLIATNRSIWEGLTVILATFEAGLSIIVVCIPLLQPVATTITTTFRSLLSRKKSRSDLRTTEPSGSDMPRPAFPFAGSEESKYKRLQDHLFPPVTVGDTMKQYTQASTIEKGDDSTVSGSIELQDAVHISGEDKHLSGVSTIRQTLEQ